MTESQAPQPTEDDAHALLPPWLAARIPALYATEHAADPTVHAKLFTPDSAWTWYITEYDPDQRLCFGLVAGLDEELGYFSLEELEAVRGPMGLRIERDLRFAPCRLSRVRRE